METASHIDLSLSGDARGMTGSGGRRAGRHRAAACLAVFLLASFSPGASAGDLVVNGDFESGAAGFGSDYVGVSSPSLIAGEGQYTVGGDPSAASVFSDWVSIGDHTTGGGKMLIVNGATSAGARIWYETVSIQAGTLYSFSFWATNVDRTSESRPVLQMLVDGVAVGDPLTLTREGGVWLQGSSTWASGSATTAVISVVSTNTSAAWNDFALDDVRFGAVIPEPASLAMAALGLPLALLAASRARRRPGRMPTAVALALLVACLAPAGADAGSIAVVNASFEDPAGEVIGYAAGWTAVNNTDHNTRYNPFLYNPSPAQGTNAWYVGANPGTDPAAGGPGYPGIDGRSLGFVYQGGPGVGIQQTLNAVLEAGASYTLTVAMGTRNGFLGGPTLGSLIELLAGDTVIASSRDDVGPAAGTFRDQVAFLADSGAYSNLIGQRLSIRLTTTLAFTIAKQATDWDDVRLVATAVPEPAAIAMLAVGAVAAGIAARRRGR